MSQGLSFPRLMTKNKTLRGVVKMLFVGLL
jgi:hypothetical protein